MKKIVVFNGIHGSGKTTVARLAAEKLGARFFCEIGGQLRNEVNYNCLESSEPFDQEVIRRELDRDRALIGSNCLPLVETWHPGNLAYIFTRSPRLAIGYLDKIKNQLNQLDPIIVHLSIAPDTFLRRATEKVAKDQLPELQAFYQEIERNLFLAYRALGISPIVISNDGALEDAVEQTISATGKVLTAIIG
jgi:thymidylate kinase